MASGVHWSFDDVVDGGLSGKSASIKVWMKVVGLDSKPISTMVCKADVEADPRSNTELQGLCRVQSGSYLGIWVGSNTVA